MALKQLSIWRNTSSISESEIIQIHGDSDKTFPIKLIRAPHTIVKNAGHFMVYKKAEIITKVIRQIIIVN